jgi:hypothetical protein
MLVKDLSSSGGYEEPNKNAAVVVKDRSSGGYEEPNNPCWNENSRAWSRTRG